jgi:hypothetical protein
MGQQWSTIYSRDLLSARAASDMEVEAKAATIMATWQDFVQRDVPALTSAIGQILSSPNHGNTVTS